MASDDYRRLLDATIRHLESLQSQGVGFVPVKAETLSALSRPARAAAPQAAVRAAPAPSAAIRTSAAPARPSPAVAVPVVTRGPAVRRPKLEPAARKAAFEELRLRVLACTRCPNLVASRTQVVFGVGDPESPLIFIGEAPGADEDLRGEPFVGMAGQLLTKIIVAMGLSRETVYIANILKCRPDTPGQTAGNRKPTPQEMATCIPYLEEQIDLIQPRAMVALGATAIEGLFGKTDAGVTRLRGSWLDFRGIPVMVTYHPAYLLRNQALSVKRLVWEDMMAVMDRLGMAITEKQRGFFLKAP